MAVSDGLDGYLARTKKQITKLGIFLDPVADKLLITSACLLLSSQRGKVAEEFLLPPTVVVLIIGKDLLLVLGFIIVYFLTSQLLVAPGVDWQDCQHLAVGNGGDDSACAGDFWCYPRLDMVSSHPLVVGGSYCHSGHPYLHSQWKPIY